MPKIVLTADRTLMSEYNSIEFIGFAACFPKVIPEWLYSRIFCPPMENDNGRARYAHAGIRKIEATLLENGFSEEDVTVAHPDKLHKVIDRHTKVLGITVHDPLGLGPASSIFSDLIGKEPYTTIFFKKLVSNNVIRERNLRVIVGGQGSWQLEDVKILAKYGIDCVVIGEGELIAKELFHKALNGEELPLIVHGEVTPVDKIPIIKKPTINGLVEIARGCGRGCRFCSPTMQKFRCQPLEKILEEVKVNVNAGQGVILHAEDVLRYKAKGPVPDEKEVGKLFNEVEKLTSDIGISHFSLAAVLAKPKLVEEIAETLDAGSKRHPWVSGQTGIETGSPRLAGEHLRGKAKPFDSKEWPDVVRESFKLMSNSRWMPCSTLIMGLPGERSDDVNKTIELVGDLREYKSLIVPLFFVPIGNLKSERFFKMKDMLPEHWQLLASCIRHNFKWVYTLEREMFEAKRISRLKSIALKTFTHYMERRLEPYVRMMEEGMNPALS